MKALIKRMIGAARLDPQVYEEVEANPATNGGAVFVVLAASVAAAIGAGVTDAAGILGVTLGAVATWMVWVVLTYVIGTRVLPGKETEATIGQVLRTTGFSASPGILRIFGFLPIFGWPIFLGVTIWMLFAFVVAIRQALDYTGSGPRRRGLRFGMAHSRIIVFCLCGHSHLIRFLERGHKARAYGDGCYFEPNDNHLLASCQQTGRFVAISEYLTC